MTLLRDIKIYKRFALLEFQRVLSYRANVLMFIFGDVLILLATYYLWNAVYANAANPVLQGFHLHEMMVYLILSFIVGNLVEADVSWMIASEVKDGSIAINLIRPISYLKRIFAQCMGGVFYNLIVIFSLGFFGIILYVLTHNIELQWWNVALFFISTSLGILISFFTSFCFGMSAFKLTNIWGVSQVMNAVVQLLSGALIPLVFFPEWAQTLVMFFPFSSIIYTPVMIFLGKLEGLALVQALGLQIVWVISLLMLSIWIWKKMVQRLVILGG
ncbi:MAG: ABC transporter permease [Erysipelotrichaceae bacterium]